MFEDEEQRSFYEDIINLRDMLPAVLFQGSDKDTSAQKEADAVGATTSDGAAAAAASAAGGAGSGAEEPAPAEKVSDSKADEVRNRLSFFVLLMRCSAFKVKQPSGVVDIVNLIWFFFFVF